MLGCCEAAQGAPRDPRRDSRGERSPWLPHETRPDSPGEPGMQPRDPCLPWRGKLGPGHTPLAPQFEKNHKMPPSRRDGGLLFPPDLESNPWSSLQTSQEPAGSTHSSTRGLRPPEQLERPAQRKRRLDSLEAAQGAPRDARRDSRGERSPWLPHEMRPDSPGEPGMQPRPLFEGNPLGEGTTRRGTATPVHPTRLRGPPTPWLCLVACLFPPS